MKIGVIYPQNELRGDPLAVREIGLATENLGFDHLLAYDHVVGATHDREPKLNGPYTENDAFHDPFVMFGYLAGITERIDFMTGVLILPQRQTVLVARQAADVDLLSSERLAMGVGIGWNYVEYDALGQDFGTRGKRVEEQVGLLRKLWDEPVVNFEGKFDRVDSAALNPRPKRQIPILLGGFVDIALQRAVAIGDGFICADGAADGFAQAARLHELLDQAGRSSGGFRLHCNMLRAKSPEQVVETARRWSDEAGGTSVSFSTMGQGFSTLGEHLAYMKTVSDALDKAGLKG